GRDLRLPQLDRVRGADRHPHRVPPQPAPRRCHPVVAGTLRGGRALSPAARAARPAGSLHLYLTAAVGTYLTAAVATHLAPVSASGGAVVCSGRALAGPRGGFDESVPTLADRERPALRLAPSSPRGGVRGRLRARLPRARGRSGRHTLVGR